MITKMRPRYYCEFCGKGNGSPSHMRKHESGCTKNPERSCRMCSMADIDQKPLAELKEIFDKNGMEALRKATENCPACILATLRQSPDSHDKSKTSNYELDKHGFDYKKEVKTFWDNYNHDPVNWVY